MITISNFNVIICIAIFILSTVVPLTAAGNFLCDFQAATTFIGGKKNSINDWDCSNGVPITPVCNWTGISCSNSIVVLINMNSHSLSGSIPSSIGNFVYVTSISLENNQLSGSLPTSIGQLALLKYLNLQSNKFTSTIPSCLGSLSSLTSMNLQSNSFTGTLPGNLAKSSSLVNLLLSSNSFSGSLPESFCTFPPTMTLLQVQLNQFTCYPVCLNSISAFQVDNIPPCSPTGQPSFQPSSQPTGQPSSQPTTRPTSQPTGQPSSQPTTRPTSQPTGQPSSQPTTRPTSQPAAPRSGQPTSSPTSHPTPYPSRIPTLTPTLIPSRVPTLAPSSYDVPNSSFTGALIVTKTLDTAVNLKPVYLTAAAITVFFIIIILCYYIYRQRGSTEKLDKGLKLEELKSNDGLKQQKLHLDNFISNPAAETQFEDTTYKNTDTCLKLGKLFTWKIRRNDSAMNEQNDYDSRVREEWV